MRNLKIGLLMVAAQVVAFSSVVHAQQVNEEGQEIVISKEDKYKVKPSFEAPEGQLFFESNLSTLPLSGYENVIVINKAQAKFDAKGRVIDSPAQKLRIYRNGQLYKLTQNGELIDSTKVSTGRENVEIVSGFKKLIKKIFGGKGTSESHWRHTTNGFYTMKRLEGPLYKSGESGFTMPYAMFFNSTNGLAIHAVPPDLSSKAGGEAGGEANLGQRSSSGCVRVHKNVVQEIRSLVDAAGRGQVPSVDPKTGNVNKKPDGSDLMIDGYRTIVIVEEF